MIIPQENNREALKQREEIISKVYRIRSEESSRILSDTGNAMRINRGRCGKNDGWYKANGRKNSILHHGN